jgi:hypothetical protein
MEPQELRYRVVQRMRTERERVRCKLARRRGQPDWEKWWSDRAPLLRHHDRHEFAAKFPEEARAIVESAGRIAAGEVVFFEHLPVSIGSVPDWHRDPVTDRRWPADRFYAGVGIRWGGAKTVWEAARHQHLVTLAQAFWLTEEPRFLETLTRQLESWFAQNRPLHGVHWTSGLEIGIRLISWFWILEICGPAAFSSELRRRWSEEIVAGGEYLANHLSAFSSANNHLIGEAAGLYVASVLVPEWRQAAAWGQTAWDVLSREATRQILPDGAPAEHAAHYLGFIVDFYLLMIAIGERRDSFSPPVIERLHAAGRFLDAITNRSGTAFRFGDEDGGTAYALTVAADAALARRISLAVVCNDRSLAPPDASYDPRSWWLFGAEGASRFEKLADTRTEPALDFPDGGYWIVRNDAADARLLFDCAPLGYLSIAAHGHADCLSVWLNVGGDEVFAEGGTYKYHEEPEWRSFFRGTAAHNTVRVDGADQSTATGPTMWQRRATPRLIAVKRERDMTWLEGEHDGYEPVTHRRAVAQAFDDYLLIIDWLLGDDTHTVERFFHLSPKLGITADGSAIAIETSNGAMNVYGGLSPTPGWHSDHFWRRQQSTTLYDKWTGSLPAVFATVVSSPGVALTVNCKTSQPEAAVTLIVEGTGWSDAWHCSPEHRRYSRSVDGVITAEKNL